MYADVSFPISGWRVFTYRIPQPLDGVIQTGIRVKAPLGRRKAVQGVVVGLGDKAKFKGKIQPIIEVVEDVPLLDATLWQLISWVSDYYLTPLGQVMRSAVPSGDWPEPVRGGGRGQGRPCAPARSVRTGA